MEWAKILDRNSLLRSALVLILAVLAAFSFLRYINWSFAYSGILGLPSQVGQAQIANHRAWAFLCMFVVLETLLAILIGSYWEPPDLGSTVLRFIARYGLGLLVSVLFTAVLVRLGMALLHV